MATWFGDYVFRWRAHHAPTDSVANEGIETVTRIKAAQAICENPAMSYDDHAAHRFDVDLAAISFSDLKTHCSAFTIDRDFAASCAGLPPDRFELNRLLKKPRFDRLGFLRYATGVAAVVRPSCCWVWEPDRLISWHLDHAGGARSLGSLIRL